ncbi:MAG: hypothetical protein JW827_12325, partial [Spirochaetes bacterium]|nr:hypothetical protein [Spirochaetota bacterium]
AGPNSYISLSGTWQGFSLPPEHSFIDLGNISGRFTITQDILLLSYLDLNKKELRLNDSLTVSFRVFLSDAITPVTSGINREHLKIYNYKGENFTSLFEVSDPVYNIDHWEISIQAVSRSPNERDYFMGIGGLINGDLLTEKYSHEDLGDNGKFNVITKNHAYPNFPNPFNPKEGPTTLRLDVLDVNDRVDIQIYSKAGLLVRHLDEGDEIKNKSEILWDGKNDAGHIVASGAYFCVIKIGDYKTINIIVIEK